MDIVIGLVVLVAIGWVTVQILPVLLPFLGYALVGIVVLVIFASIMKNKR